MVSEKVDGRNDKNTIGRGKKTKNRWSTVKIKKVVRISPEN